MQQNTHQRRSPGTIVHRASQNQGIRRHTWHTAERIEKRTVKINGAKMDGTKASCCLDVGVAWTNEGGVQYTFVRALSVMDQHTPSAKGPSQRGE